MKKALTIGSCVLVSLAWSVATTNALPTQQSEKTQMQRSITDTTNTTQAIKKFAGRLPRYFGSVVDEKQRESIYAIQQMYYEQIDELEERLAELREEQQQKIDAVLSNEQHQQIADLRIRAQSKRVAAQSP